MCHHKMMNLTIAMVTANRMIVNKEIVMILTKETIATMMAVPITVTSTMKMRATKIMSLTQIVTMMTVILARKIAKILLMIVTRMT